MTVTDESGLSYLPYAAITQICTSVKTGWRCERNKLPECIWDAPGGESLSWSWSKTELGFLKDLRDTRRIKRQKLHLLVFHLHTHCILCVKHLCTHFLIKQRCANVKRLGHTSASGVVVQVMQSRYSMSFTECAIKLFVRSHTKTRF